MNITIEQLDLMIPDAPDLKIEKFYEPIVETLDRYQINSRLRIAAFLAQIAHETGSLRYIEELWGPTDAQVRYDLPHKKAFELGNNLPEALSIAKLHDTTPGFFYRGRGGIQITGYLNYLKVARALDIDCINTPQLLTDPMNAMLSSGFFWISNGRNVEGENLNCNELADICYFTLITRVINGGTSGLDHRLKFYRNNLQVLI